MNFMTPMRGYDPGPGGPRVGPVSPAAIPHRPDRRLGPARTKAAAVPAPAVEARVAVPVLRAAARPREVIVPFDPLGRPVAGQEAIPMPRTNGGAFGVRGGGSCAR